MEKRLNWFHQQHFESYETLPELQTSLAAALPRTVTMPLIRPGMILNATAGQRRLSADALDRWPGTRSLTVPSVGRCSHKRSLVKINVSHITSGSLKPQITVLQLQYTDIVTEQCPIMPVFHSTCTVWSRNQKFNKQEVMWQACLVVTPDPQGLDS